jgi:ABC-type branched-subunit amino acid transport system substrate-binding protein
LFKRFLIALFLLLAAFSPAFAQTPIIVGLSGPMTGPSRSLGIEIYRGTVSYFNYVNSQGGVFGHKILIKAYDDGYNSTRTIRNTIELIEHDKVFGLISYFGTEPVTRVMPLLKIYEKTDTLLFFPSTGAQSPRKPPYKEFVINYRPTYSDEASAIVNNFLRIGLRRIAVFYQADAYGRSGWYGVHSTLAENNLPIVAEITHKKGLNFKSNMTGQVKYLRSFNPDAIISIGAYEPTAAFVRDARMMGWDVPVARLSVGSDTFVKLLNEASKSLSADLTRNIINTQIFPNYDQTDVPLIREYRRVFDQFSQLPPANLMKDEYKASKYSYGSLEGYVNAKIFVEILKELGPELEKGKIKKAVAKIKKLDIGLDQKISLSDLSGPVYFTTVVDGNLVPLKDFSQWKK